MSERGERSRRQRCSAECSGEILEETRGIRDCGDWRPMCTGLGSAILAMGILT